MALNDLTGQNIQDTYQKVVQTDGTNLADGTGSLLPISFDGNNVIISGSLSATEYTVTSSVTNVVFQQQSGSTLLGDSLDDIHVFTGSLFLTGSVADINGLEILGNPNTQGVATGLAEAIKLRGSDTTRIDFNANNLTLASGIAGAGSTFVTSLGIPSGVVTINPEKHALVDFRVAGDNDSNLIFADASEDKIAIGTNTVGDSLLTIDGDLTATNITASGDISASGDIFAANLVGIINGGDF